MSNPIPRPPEYVYLITNPSMPGLVKIGKTNDLVRRLAELNNTSVPTPFTLDHYVELSSERVAHQVEQATHAALAAQRVAPNREFFRVTLAQAVGAVEQVLRDRFPGEQGSMNERRERADRETREKIDSLKIKLEAIKTEAGIYLSKWRAPNIDREDWFSSMIARPYTSAHAANAWAKTGFCFEDRCSYCQPLFRGAIFVRDAVEIKKQINELSACSENISYEELRAVSLANNLSVSRAGDKETLWCEPKHKRKTVIPVTQSRLTR